MTGFPSATALALTLGADSPCVDERCAGNLGLSATRPFTLFIATHVSIRTSDISSRPLDPPSQTYGTLLYHRSRSFNTHCSHRPPPRPSSHGTFCNSQRARNETRARLVAKRGGDAVCLKDLERSAASVIGLSPVTSSAQDDSISELLRFL